MKKFDSSFRFPGMIINLIRDLQSLFFPNLCQACSRELLKGEEVLCLHCAIGLPRLNQTHELEQVFWGRLRVEAVDALYFFRKGSRVQKLIHQLKYRRQAQVGSYLGRRLGEHLQESGKFTDLDMVVPIPLYWKRMRSRGYNQSALIAEGLAMTLKIELGKNIVIRGRPTKTQTRSGSRYKRWENVSESFNIPRPEFIRGKHILLVDDVITSGATMEACGSMLLKAGASKISLAALAFSER